MPTTPTFARYPLVAWLERRSRRQVVSAVAVVLVYLVFRGASSVAGVILDRWWYRSVTTAPVWSTITWARVELLVGATVVTAIVLGGSLTIVARQGRLPDAFVGGIVRRYRGRMGPAHTWLLVGIVLVLVVRIAGAASANWQLWLLFRRGGHLDRSVPELGGDLGFYLFDLPLLSVVSAWFRQLVVVTIVVTIFASLVSGGLRLPGRGRKSQRRAVAHIGLLAALFAGAQTLDYVFVRRPSLAVSRTGSFVGPGYTELRVAVPVSWLLAVMALVAGFALVVGARTHRWKVPAIVVGCWAAAHVIGVVALPTLVNRVVVAPAEADRQLPYLAENLDATRLAYRLDTIEQTSGTVADGVGEAALSDTDALNRVVMFDPDSLPAPLQVLQGRTASRITDVDIDRYVIDGQLRPVLVAPRNASRADLPETGWVQTHLVYTHGDGVVAVPADQPDADGRPDVDSLADTLVPTRPQLYFGENLGGWYAIVDTQRAEQGGTRFSADTGIGMSSLFQRAVLSLTTGDIEPLFSAELTADSQLLYRRGVAERLHALAPFMTFGTDPYPVITADGVTWIVDGYTTAATYPYSQFVGLGGETVNYVRASVKATVDAYDGTVHLYRTEVGGQADPILDTWDAIFPGLLEPISDMPAELQAHLRYAPELLGIQNALIGRYHVDDAETLFNGTQRWSPAAAASSTVATATTGPSQPVLMFMPDQADLGGHWVSTLPFSPGTGAGNNSARDVLVALGAADNDNPEQMVLLGVETPPGRDVSTPLVAQSAIDADPDIAQRITLLNANGSQVQFGPMTPLLIDDGLAWVRSILVIGTSSTTTPRLYGVVAVSNGLVGFGPDVESALQDALAQAAPSG